MGNRERFPRTKRFGLGLKKEALRADGQSEALRWERVGQSLPRRKRGALRSWLFEIAEALRSRSWPEESASLSRRRQITKYFDRLKRFLPAAPVRSVGNSDAGQRSASLLRPPEVFSPAGPKRFAGDRTETEALPSRGRSALLGTGRFQRSASPGNHERCLPGAVGWPSQREALPRPLFFSPSRPPGFTQALCW